MTKLVCQIWERYKGAKSAVPSIAPSFITVRAHSSQLVDVLLRESCSKEIGERKGWGKAPPRLEEFARALERLRAGTWNTKLEIAARDNEHRERVERRARGPESSRNRARTTSPFSPGKRA